MASGRKYRAGRADYARCVAALDAATAKRRELVVALRVAREEIKGLREGVLNLDREVPALQKEEEKLRVALDGEKEWLGNR